MFYLELGMELTKIQTDKNQIPYSLKNNATFTISIEVHNEQVRTIDLSFGRANFDIYDSSVGEWCDEPFAGRGGQLVVK